MLGERGAFCRALVFVGKIGLVVGVASLEGGLSQANVLLGVAIAGDCCLVDDGAFQAIVVDWAFCLVSAVAELVLGVVLLGSEDVLLCPAIMALRLGMQLYDSFSVCLLRKLLYL